MINLGTLPLGELRGEVELEPPGAAGRELGRKPVGPCVKAALATLIEETAALTRGLRAAVEDLHVGEAPSGGRRALLRDLARLGPQTVPQLARSRAVTRQHIQALVNPLAEAGYVELLDNPAHRRSRLVGLTGRGRELVSGMDRRESEALWALEVAAPSDELLRAAGVLRSVRESLEGRLS